MNLYYPSNREPNTWWMIENFDQEYAAWVEKTNQRSSSTKLLPELNREVKNRLANVGCRFVQPAIKSEAQIEKLEFFNFTNWFSDFWRARFPEFDTLDDLLQAAHDIVAKRDLQERLDREQAELERKTNIQHFVDTAKGLLPRPLQEFITADSVKFIGPNSAQLWLRIPDLAHIVLNFKRTNVFYEFSSSAPAAVVTYLGYPADDLEWGEGDRKSDEPAYSLEWLPLLEALEVAARQGNNYDAARASCEESIRARQARRNYENDSPRIDSILETEKIYRELCQWETEDLAESIQLRQAKLAALALISMGGQP